MYQLWFDGLFRGVKTARKAGLMCFGWLILRDGWRVASGYGIAARGMSATSNMAEYLGLVDGLEALADIGTDCEPVHIFGDAKVVINQMQGLARINVDRVFPLYRKAHRLAELLYVTDWRWVPRRENKAADHLTRVALREFRADPVSARETWHRVLGDHARKRDQLHMLGGMMVYQGNITNG